MARAYTRLEFHVAVARILAIASAGNLYLEERAPWANFKKGGEAAYLAGSVGDRQGRQTKHRKPALAVLQ